MTRPKLPGYLAELRDTYAQIAPTVVSGDSTEVDYALVNYGASVREFVGFTGGFSACQQFLGDRPVRRALDWTLSEKSNGSRDVPPFWFIGPDRVGEPNRRFASQGVVAVGGLASVRGLRSFYKWPVSPERESALRRDIANVLCGLGAGLGLALSSPERPTYSADEATEKAELFKQVFGEIPDEGACRVEHVETKRGLFVVAAAGFDWSAEYAATMVPSNKCQVPGTNDAVTAQMVRVLDK